MKLFKKVFKRKAKNKPLPTKTDNKKHLYIGRILKKEKANEKPKRSFFHLLIPRKNKKIAPRYFYTKIIGGILISISVICIVFFSGIFSIKNIEINSPSVESEAIINQHLDSALDSKILKIFPQNTLFFSFGDIKSEILKNNPHILDIRISHILPNSIKITVVERDIVGIWCSQTKECFYYGNYGVIFRKAPTGSQGFLISFVTDERHEDFYLGKTVLTQKDIKDIEILYLALQKSIGAPSHLKIINENEIQAFFQDGWRAIYSRQDQFVRQTENLSIVLDEYIKNKEKPLDYVDLRYGNKVFYRHIDLEEPESEIPNLEDIEDITEESEEQNINDSTENEII